MKMNVISQNVLLQMMFIIISIISYFINIVCWSQFRKSKIITIHSYIKENKKIQCIMFVFPCKAFILKILHFHLPIAGF